jgi:hypothetical protein
MMLAIIMDTYVEVKHSSVGAETLWSQAKETFYRKVLSKDKTLQEIQEKLINQMSGGEDLDSSHYSANLKLT